MAIIRISKQDIAAKGTQELTENLTLTPWRSVPEHRPLGAINRSRRVIYEPVSEFRRSTNRVPRKEPTEFPR